MDGQTDIAVSRVTSRLKNLIIPLIVCVSVIIIMSNFQLEMQQSLQACLQTQAETMI